MGRYRKFDEDFKALKVKDGRKRTLEARRDG